MNPRRVHSPPHGRRTFVDVVALLGPPGSGKSTLAMALTAERRDARVFRLREFAHQEAQTDRTVASALVRSRDPLGWLPDGVPTVLVRRALDGYASDGGVLLMESYPGTPNQARSLVRDLSRLGCRGGLIELAAPESVLLNRIQQRLVCAVCDPRRRRPAQPRLDEPGRCDSCGTELERRANDAPTVAARRLDRYQRYAPQTLAVLQASGLVCHTVDSTQAEPLLIAAALSAFRSLAPVHPSLPRKGIARDNRFLTDAHV
ncbi:nucleoside monophosphate kinase [Streptomyces shenzhenensis]|uniref:adenylate kinase family protein n=1 Tax=Streptomyces shenzhenensis TaxID=943815 RepID=UPI00287B6C54|nr:nucleoside monophosphate kinase [Streptomyces shenzhenensis]